MLLVHESILSSSHRLRGCSLLSQFPISAVLQAPFLQTGNPELGTWTVAQLLMLRGLAAFLYCL